MPTIITKPFDQDMQNTLGELRSGYHATELSKKEISELPEQLYVIEADDTMVGYGVIWEYSSGNQLTYKAEQDYFEPEGKYLEKDFYIDIKGKTDIVFIEVLDVLKDYERKDYGTFFVDWLKEKYAGQKMYVYSIEKSRNFWYKQGFEPVGSTIWMSYN